jgi:HEPN domain-containing protein
MENNEIVEYWINASEGDFELSQSLFESKRYSYSLFFTHLAVEKLLKGLIVHNTHNTAPYEHNLVRLAEVTGIAFSEEQLDLLTDITTFNIKGRYDDYKNQFYKTATREYTEKYLTQAKELIQWLKKHFQTAS